jgi:Phytanoyl-CoA dioxygenase (PhyH)
MNDADIERFIADGFLHLEGAFARSTAAECVDILWEHMDVDRTDPTTWTRPVVRVDGSAAKPFTDAINTPLLIDTIDALVGPDRWLPRTEGYGTFPVRFPSEADPGDAGWHIDGSFGEGPFYRVNFVSKGRALLLLMLFSDVGPDDAPTRIRVGSHLDVSRALVGVGDNGCFFDVGRAPAAADRPVITATGRAGDVFVCHPFLMHAASWPHRGTQPRFIGQPCIHHAAGEWLGRFEYGRADPSPVERAVLRAIG